MPRKKAEEDIKPKRMVDHPMSYIADHAATASVRLSMSGEPLTPQSVWAAIREPIDQKSTPVYFEEVLKSPTYLTLLDIRLRRATLSTLEEIGFLKDTLRDVAKLAADSVLEDMILYPHSVKTSEKAKIAVDFSDKYEKLLAKQGAKPQVQDALEAATDQTDEMRNTLDRLPPELRERTIRRWKLDEMKKLEVAESELRNGGQESVATDG